MLLEYYDFLYVVVVDLFIFCFWIGCLVSGDRFVFGLELVFFHCMAVWFYSYCFFGSVFIFDIENICSYLLLRALSQGICLINWFFCFF